MGETNDQRLQAIMMHMLTDQDGLAPFWDDLGLQDCVWCLQNSQKLNKKSWGDRHLLATPYVLSDLLEGDGTYRWGEHPSCNDVMPHLKDLLGWMEWWEHMETMGYSQAEREEFFFHSKSQELLQNNPSHWKWKDRTSFSKKLAEKGMHGYLPVSVAHWGILEALKTTHDVKRTAQEFVELFAERVKRQQLSEMTEPTWHVLREILSVLPKHEWKWMNDKESGRDKFYNDLLQAMKPWEEKEVLTTEVRQVSLQKPKVM